MDDAFRLTFEYRDGQYVPLPAQKVRMVVPQPSLTRSEAAVDGRFLELRAADGTAVRAVRVAGLEPPSAEFPSDDPDRPLGRTEPPPGAVLSVVVPAHERATEAALVEVVTTRTRGETRLSRRDLAIVRLGGAADE